MGLTRNKLLLATHLEAITAYKTAAQERLPPFFFRSATADWKTKETSGSVHGVS